MQIDVLKNLIYLTKHGSHAYGLERPESDVDLKGILIPPTHILLGYMTNFEQSINNDQLHKSLYNFSMDKLDSTIFSLQKFFNLAAQCNPNVIEILWVDDADILFTTIAGEAIREARQLFLSLNAKHTFSGYAHAQLKRMETHRKWLLNPPKGRPQRSDFFLPEMKLISKDALGTVKKLEGSGYRFSEDLMTAVTREKQYASALRYWNQYENWKKTRNPKRAVLEEKCGYDSKNALHLIRLMRMCVEILRGDGVIVKRQFDADELRHIINGGWTYDRLMETADILETTADELYQLNPANLPYKPDHNKLNALCVKLQESHD